MPNAIIAIYRQKNILKRKIPNEANFIFFSLEEALAFKPRLTIISSPATEHVKNAKQFLAIDSHLFIEKPISNSLNGVELLIERVNQSTLFSMVGYVLRFLPMLNNIKNLIEQNIIGDIKTALIQVGQYLPDWRPQDDYRLGVSSNDDLGGGVLLELSHELDYVIWLFGNPHELFCTKARISDLEINVEDHAILILEYHKNVQRKNITIHLDFLQRIPNRSIQIVGTTGTLKANLLTEELKLFTPKYPNGKEIKTQKVKNNNEIYLRQFDFLFSRCFKEYKEHYNKTKKIEKWANIESAKNIIKLIDIANQSNRKRQKIKLSKQ